MFDAMSSSVGFEYDEPAAIACFEYSIFYLGHLLEFDESQMPKDLGGVVAQIEAIISAHTIPPNA